MNAWKVEVFHDGDCPLCMREIRMLQRMDKRRGLIRFTDIAAPDFDANAYGKEQQEPMARIQGRNANGDWLDGVEVFRELYSAVGFGPVVALSRVVGVRQLGAQRWNTGC